VVAAFRVELRKTGTSLKQVASRLKTSCAQFQSLIESPVPWERADRAAKRVYR